MEGEEGSWVSYFSQQKTVPAALLARPLPGLLGQGRESRVNYCVCMASFSPIIIREQQQGQCREMQVS